MGKYSKGSFWRSFNEGWRAVDPAVNRLNQYWDQQGLAEAMNSATAQSTNNVYGQASPEEIAAAQNNPVMNDVRAENAEFGVDPNDPRYAPQVATTKVTDKTYTMGNKTQATPFTAEDRQMGGLRAAAEYYRKQGKADKAMDMEKDLLSMESSIENRDWTRQQRKDHMTDRGDKMSGRGILANVNMKDPAAVATAVQILHGLGMSAEANDLQKRLEEMTKKRVYSAAGKGKKGIFEEYSKNVPDGWDVEERKNSDGTFSAVQFKNEGGKKVYGAELIKYRNDDDLQQQFISAVPELVPQIMQIRAADARHREEMGLRKSELTERRAERTERRNEGKLTVEEQATVNTMMDRYQKATSPRERALINDEYSNLTRRISVGKGKLPSSLAPSADTELTPEQLDQEKNTNDLIKETKGKMLALEAAGDHKGFNSKEDEYNRLKSSLAKLETERPSRQRAQARQLETMAGDFIKLERTEGREGAIRKMVSTIEKENEKIENPTLRKQKTEQDVLTFFNKATDVTPDELGKANPNKKKKKAEKPKPAEATLPRQRDVSDDEWIRRMQSSQPSGLGAAFTGMNNRQASLRNQ